MAAYRAEKERYFQAVLTNNKLDEWENERRASQQQQQQQQNALLAPKRKILKNLSFSENELNNKQGTLDGFYLVYITNKNKPKNWI